MSDETKQAKKDTVNMRPNAKNLAMRDPALAALMGAISPAGQNADFGAEFGDDWGLDDDFAGDDDWGAEFGAAVVKAKPTPAKVAALWNKHSQQQSQSQRRNMLLEPNKNSSIKVERYAFTLSQAITIGTAVALALTGQPDTTIRPQRVTMNAPTPMFATISEIRVANVAVTVGSGDEDAYNYNPLGQGMELDMPTLSPANRATVRGSYTGFVPPGFINGTAVTFSASFRGPASIVA